MQFIPSCNSCICDVPDFLSIVVQRIRRLVILELSSILPFRKYVWSEMLSLPWLILLASELDLFEILHIRDGRPRISIDEQKFAAEIHECKWDHGFRFRFSELMISVSIKKRFRNIRWVWYSNEKFITPKTCWCLQKISSLSENVSWFNLFGLQNNATNFPVLAGSWDELDIQYARSEW